jgi:hypothetical protein
VKRVKDEGGKMKVSKDEHLPRPNEARASVFEFPFSISHFSFFVSYLQSLILHPSSFIP